MQGVFAKAQAIEWKQLHDYLMLQGMLQSLIEGPPLQHSSQQNSQPQGEAVHRVHVG